jgi:hypothetical protein
VFNLPITLAAPQPVTVTVDYANNFFAGPGFATENVDYAPAGSGTLAFLPGETVKTVPVTVFGDTLDEPPLFLGEWFTIRFLNASPTVRLDLSLFGIGIGIIGDDDP